MHGEGRRIDFFKKTTYVVKISILMTSLCEVRGKTGPGANKSKQEINCIGSAESGRGATAESIIAFESRFFFRPCIVNNRNLFSFNRANENLSNVMSRDQCIKHLPFIFNLFFLEGGVKRERIQNSASVITKESLFGTLPPQMATRLMFLSRCVAFSLA